MAGVMTLDDFETEVWLSLKERSELDRAVPSALTLLQRAVNKAYRHICLPNIFEHPELELEEDVTLVASTFQYGLSSTPWVIQQVIYRPDADDFRELPKRSWRNTVGWRHPSGEPTYYARRGRDFYINSSPSATEAGDIIRLYVYELPADLAGTGVTVLNQAWDAPITELAKFYAWLLLGQNDRADAQREVAAALINEVMETAKLEAEDDGERIDPSPAVPYQRIN